MQGSNVIKMPQKAAGIKVCGFFFVGFTGAAVASVFVLLHTVVGSHVGKVFGLSTVARDAHFWICIHVERCLGNREQRMQKGT